MRRLLSIVCLLVSMSLVLGETEIGIRYSVFNFSEWNWFGQFFLSRTVLHKPDIIDRNGIKLYWKTNLVGGVNLVPCNDQINLGFRFVDVKTNADFVIKVYRSSDLKRWSCVSTNKFSGGKYTDVNLIGDFDTDLLFNFSQSFTNSLPSPQMFYKVSIE